MTIIERPMQNQNNMINIVIEECDQRQGLLNLLDELHVNYVNQNNLSVFINKIQLRALIKSLREQSADQNMIDQFRQIYQRHQIILKGQQFEMDLTTEPAIMAILNTSPDSFFDGDPKLNDAKLLAKVESFMSNNTKIIDLGGQSTRPGYEEISPELEIERTVPYIQMIKRAFPEAVISVDSYKPAVIQAVLDAGADIINDINGFEDNDEKLKLVEQYHPALIAMYNNRISKWPLEAMRSFFENRTQTFAQLGLNKQNWVIDPGVGFLTPNSDHHDVEIINHLRELTEMDIPTLIAISRKSMFKKRFGINAAKNVWSTLVAELMMVELGGRIIRVHDVEETNLMLQMRKQLMFPKGLV